MSSQYSITGPWTPEEEEELLGLYGFQHIEFGILEDVYQLVRPGPKQKTIYSRHEALEWIKQIRRTAYGYGGV